MILPERLAFLAERLEVIARDIELAAQEQDEAKVAQLLDELERVSVELEATLPTSASAGVS